MIYDPYAAQMALTVMRTLDMFLKDPTERHPPFDPLIAAAYDLKGYIAASDALFTADASTGKLVLTAANYTVFYGFLATSKANPDQHIVVIRGTGSILEWAKDGQFLWDVHPDGGFVECGFYSIYRTMTFEAYENGQFTGLETPVGAGIAKAVPKGSVQIVAHSLGSTQGTYLALDLALHQNMADRSTALLFASPHTGDIGFAEMVDRNFNYNFYNYWRDLAHGFRSLAMLRCPAQPYSRTTTRRRTSSTIGTPVLHLQPWLPASCGLLCGDARLSGGRLDLPTDRATLLASSGRELGRIDALEPPR
jgi:hypothetical protein